MLPPAAAGPGNVKSDGADSSPQQQGGGQQIQKVSLWSSADIVTNDLTSMVLSDSPAHSSSTGNLANPYYYSMARAGGLDSGGPSSAGSLPELQGGTPYSGGFQILEASTSLGFRSFNVPGSRNDDSAQMQYHSGMHACSEPVSTELIQLERVDSDLLGMSRQSPQPQQPAWARHSQHPQHQHQHHQQQHDAARFDRMSVSPKVRGDAQGQGRQRGQDYRKLWQQVTKVNKGQKLSESVADVTVEDLVRILTKLAPRESAVSAVEQGLYHLDSSALAALLKELAKQGHLKRAVEIFDWLRGLDPGHELHRLCDLYTYTTMISQCGAHKELRRALELVAEMRSKGITCNVHTYSALMNVCIKAGELELAQDVFDQMVEEKCTPNLVTFNILIDVHVKNGQWEEAVAKLDTLERQGIQAEVRTYNTIINVCNKSGQPEQALKIYDRMLAAGVRPSSATYTALINAYGKRGMVDKAMSIYDDMVRSGCECNVVTYSSLISACEKAGRWEQAMNLFSEMHREGCKPNVVIYNSLIATCSHTGHWEESLKLFDQMQKEGCLPDGTTFAALIGAYVKGGQWRRALQAMEQMQAQGCQPDAVILNNVMDVLWQSGVLVAHLQALQLWTSANKNGQLRIYINSRSTNDHVQYNTVAFTCGAIHVTVLRWLAELRSKLAKDGPAFFRSRISLSLSKSKQASRGSDDGEQSHSAHESLAAMLSGARSPLKVQSEEGGLVVEAARPEELISWLQSPDFSELMYMQGPLKNVPVDLSFNEDAAVAHRCTEAFSSVRRTESAYIMNLAAYNPSVLQQRSQVVHLAMKYGNTFGWKDSVFDGLQLFDKVLCSGAALNVNMWPLVLGVCLMLAQRHADPSGVSFPGYDKIALLTGFGGDAVAAMEQSVLLALQQDVSTISALRVMQLCLERLGYCLQGDSYGLFRLSDRVSSDMQALLIKVSCSPITIGLRPSVVGAASLVVLRKLKGMVPFWPLALQSMTSYVLQPGSDLHTCTVHIEGLL